MLKELAIQRSQTTADGVAQLQKRNSRLTSGRRRPILGLRPFSDFKIHTDKTMTNTSLAVLALALAGLVAPLAAQDRTPILFDTDIGSDVDDAFALALILASPEVELRGVTTVSGNTADRAILACRFLAQTGQRNIPVAAGAEPQPKQDLSGQYQYRNHPAAIYGRAGKPVSPTAAEFLYQKIKAEPGQLTLCSSDR